VINILTNKVKTSTKTPINKGGLEGVVIIEIKGIEFIQLLWAIKKTPCY